MRDMAEQANLVLRRLAAGARLEALNDGSSILIHKRIRRAVTAELTALLQRNEWLRREDGAFTLSESGSAWLAAATGSDDPFEAQHRLLNTKLVRDERGCECYVVVNEAESPLGVLRYRGLIGARQFEAGERLRRDFTTAQLTPRMGVDFSAPVGRRSGKPELLITETAMAAKQRFNRAMRAVGPGLSDVLFDVCCILRGLEECEQVRNWPRASAKVVLRIALDRLAAHYRMDAQPRRRVRSWKMENGNG